MKFDYEGITEDVVHRLARFQHAALTSRNGLRQTFLIAEQAIIDGIDGDFVECGVAYGACAAAMALAIQKHGEQRKRKLHLFDSFEGIPLAGPADRDQPGIGRITHDTSLPIEQRLVSSGISACSQETVSANLIEWGFSDVEVVCHKGWFQHTLPGNNLGKIAMLRLDGDLVESTICCLEHLYPKVTDGGYVLDDDYLMEPAIYAGSVYFSIHPPLPDIRVTADTNSGYWKKGAPAFAGAPPC